MRGRGGWNECLANDGGRDASRVGRRSKRTLALRLFGEHLLEVRERSVLDNHLQHALHPFWELPLVARSSQQVGR